MLKPFADELKRIKKENGLKQQDVADLLQISKRSVEEWERGKSKPPEYAQVSILKDLEYRAKNIEPLQIELYGTDEDIKKRLAEIVEAGEGKSTYVKRLIREDIAKEQNKK